jgi:hypothetical protein
MQSGKTNVLQCIMDQTRIHFGRQIGFYGSAVSTAPTGAAAYAVNGSTWHKVLAMGFMSSNNTNDVLSSQVIKTILANIEGIKLLIADELSLISLKDLDIIDHRLKEAARNSCDPTRVAMAHLPYGGIHIIFAGDFNQLVTFNGEPVWKSKLKLQRDIERQKKWREQLTHYYRLTLNYRARDDPQYADLMRHARAGTVTDAHIALANTRLVGSIDDARRESHPYALWLTSTHAKVNILNEAALSFLAEEGRHVALVIAQHAQVTAGAPAPSQADLNDYFSCPGSFRANSAPPTHVFYAVNMRVRLLGNKATELGLFSGAMGTIV